MSGDLIARCRAALAASDETAKGPLFPARTFAGTPIGGPDEERLALNRALTVVLDGIEATWQHHPRSSRKRAFGGCGTNPDEDHFCLRCMARWPCPDSRDATASLAAIAEALGVQP